jgi:hypothetical protein
MSNQYYTAKQRADKRITGDEHNLNRNTFLQTAKKLEKAELLRIVKANGRGKTAKFLERVA